jgi:DNA modification methylase
MEPESFVDGRIKLYCGDSASIIKEFPDNYFDSIVCDPPYALVSIQKRFGKADSKAVIVPEGGTGAYARASKGFMNQTWDTGETAFAIKFWQECLRVLKPGGYVVAFGGTRTYHRLACAIEDAGFEIRDMLQWLYGSGFPKSHDVSKGIVNSFAAKREVVGSDRNFGKSKLKDGKNAFGDYAGEWDITIPATDEAKEWEGWGTALKPANEPIVLARKPLSEPTVAANVLKWRTGALNIDGCRVEGEPSPAADRRATARKTGWDATGGGITAKETDKLGRIQRRGNPETFKQERSSEQLGRWPANVVHDGSDEVVDMFPNTKSGQLLPTHNVKASENGSMSGRNYAGRVKSEFGGDSGSASRFFYQAKANKTDRAGSKHPTVKPVDLMQWLVRLVTPRNGIVLDPFAGTGTTAEAAFREGGYSVLIERETEYQADIRRRMGLVVANKQKSEIVKKYKKKPEPIKGGSFFKARIMP